MNDAQAGPVAVASGAKWIGEVNGVFAARFNSRAVLLALIPV